MQRGNIKLKNVERFKGDYVIPKSKIDDAIKRATDKLYSVALRLGFDKFPGKDKNNDKIYIPDENRNWTYGMYTGEFLLAYELTGDEKFLEVVRAQLPGYQWRIDENIRMNDHDVGFVFVPSCVAYYKLTGDKKMRDLSLMAAEHLYNHSFSKEGGFVIRLADLIDEHEDAYRTMMDTLMNISLFFWAYEETGDKKFFDAANSQLNITESCLMREDGSSYHHYQFDRKTHKPQYGCTFQGHRDESTWSRGHAWGILGFPIAYDYNGDKNLLLLHRDASYFMLDHLPEDYIPYWDYDFIDGDAYKDSSAGAISACGLLEACKYLPDDADEKLIYKNAALKMIDSLIDNYTGDIGEEFDGLVAHVAGAVPFDMCNDSCATYGDFFYLEALLRLSKPDWKRYW